MTPSSDGRLPIEEAVAAWEHAFEPEAPKQPQARGPGDDEADLLELSRRAGARQRRDLVRSIRRAAARDPGLALAALVRIAGIDRGYDSWDECWGSGLLAEQLVADLAPRVPDDAPGWPEIEAAYRLVRKELPAATALAVRRRLEERRGARRRSRNEKGPGSGSSRGP